MWSIEAAVESGRLSARVIVPSVKVIPQHKPLWLRAISVMDDVCFAIGAPHVLDLFLVVFLVALSVLLAQVLVP